MGQSLHYFDVCDPPLGSPRTSVSIGREKNVWGRTKKLYVPIDFKHICRSKARSDHSELVKSETKGWTERKKIKKKLRQKRITENIWNALF